MMPQLFTENSADFASVNDSAAQHPLGTLAWNYNSTYKSWQLLRYIQVTGAIAGTAYAVCTIGDAYGTVTPDRDSDQLAADQFGGVLLGGVTADYYGWVVVGGIAVCQGDGAENAGESVICHTVDSQMDTMAATEEDHVFGTCLLDATTSANDVPVQLKTMI